MRQEGDAAKTTSSEDMTAKADNIDASVGAQQLSNGAAVEVIRVQTTTCSSEAGGLATDLSLVKESHLGMTGWVFTEHLTP